MPFFGPKIQFITLREGIMNKGFPFWLSCAVEALGAFSGSRLKARTKELSPTPSFFYRTQIRVCLRFLAKNKNADGKRGFHDCLELDNQLALAA